VACTVVCVSHAAGSGGREVGKQVAERLGYVYAEEEILGAATTSSRFYGVDRESPTHYDLVINADVFSTQQAADIISQAVGQ
jgi:cytidylate kinase